MIQNIRYQNSEILLEDNQIKEPDEKLYKFLKIKKLIKKCSLKNFFFIVVPILLFIIVILLISGQTNSTHHIVISKNYSETELIHTDSSIKNLVTELPQVTSPKSNSETELILATSEKNLVSELPQTTSPNSIPSSKSPYDSKIFISDAIQIKIYDLKTNESSLIHEKNDILSFDVTDSSIFYVEKFSPIIETVYNSRINLTLPINTLPEAIAVDYLTKKFYLLNKSAKAVYVINFDGKFSRRVLSNIEDLHDIVLDVNEGLIFIVQYMKSISRANLDGTELKAIVSRKKVSAMALDRQGKKIFWAADMAKIIRSDYNGKNRTILLTIEVALITSLTFYKNQLFWLYSTSYNKKTPRSCIIERNVCNNQREIPLLLDEPQAIKAYVDPSYLESGIENPCEVNNGNCSEFCFISYRKHERVCTCKTGFKLNSDSQSCMPASDFILYLQENYIIAKSIDDAFEDFVISMNFTSASDEIHFDYDFHNDNLYFVDDDYMKIMKIRNESEPVILFDCVGCHDLTFDWASKNLYYVKNGMLRVFYYKSDTVIEKRIGDVSTVSHLTIDANKGKIFFTSISMDGYYFYYSYNADGSNYKSFHTSRYDIGSASLAFDYNYDKLYFLKGTRVYNTYSSYSIYDSFEIYNKGNLLSINVYKKYLYAQNSTNIWRMKKNSRYEVEEVVKSMHNKILGMKIIEVKNYEKDYECAINNGGCEHFCFARPQKTCGCMDGYELQTNGSCKKSK